MAYNFIQLFALKIPTKISLPYDLYSLTVPQHWKELFSRLQQIKSGRDKVLPPTECLNQALLLLINNILFPCKKAFWQDKERVWLYTKNQEIAHEIARIVQMWLLVSFENVSESIPQSDLDLVHSLSGSDLSFKKVNLPEPVWKIENGKTIIDPLYYNLIPYLCGQAIVSTPLSLLNPVNNETFELIFRESASERSDAQELISWQPEVVVEKRKNKDSQKQEEIIQNYSYHISVALHYDGFGVPYLNCEYGIRCWVNWRLNYLGERVTVCISPSNSVRFTSTKLKYMGKKRGIDFESNLVHLIQQLNFQDRFTAEDVLENPYKNQELSWALVYSNKMSRTHNAGAGLYPKDVEIFHQAFTERIQQNVSQEFLPVETYVRCDGSRSLKKARSEYQKIQNFIKSDPASIIQDVPFYIPANLRIVLLVQSQEAEDLSRALAKKYGINDLTVRSLGSLGSELSGKNWQIDCKSRIKEFQKELSPSPLDKKTLTLIEILPKAHFWKNSKKDPKPCFRPALAQLGSVVDHFVLKEDDDFAYRVENTLLSGLAMAGAYFYPTFEAENFPSDVAIVGVYRIPFYKGETTKHFLAAVRIDKTGISAKAYDCDDWLDFHTFQVRMASGQFSAIKLKKNEIQAWIFNSLFKETKQATLFCFDADNLRNYGLDFLQKKRWQKYSLVWNTDENTQLFIPLAKYPNVRVASIITPETTEVPIYRACDEEGELEGHTAGVFYPSSKDSECGSYYLSNQKPDSRSDGILQKSKLVSLPITRGKNEGQLKQPKLSGQGYNPRGIFLNLTLQEGDRFGDWANFVQCSRLYGLIHYLGTTNFSAALHLAQGLAQYRPIQAIREP